MPGATFEQTDDHALSVTVSQSWLNTYLRCPEQARAELVGELPRVDSDATAIGTAVHTGIETMILGGTFEEGVANAFDEFERLARLETFEWIQVKSMSTALTYVRSCLAAFDYDVRRHVGDPVSIEHRFTLPFDEFSPRDESDAVYPRVNYWRRVKVHLDGAWDLLDNAGVIWDWKTAARPYEPWEKERWAIQPTFYGWACNELHGFWPTFTYAVMFKGPQPKPAQVLNIERGPGHVEFMRRQIRSAIDMWMLFGTARSWPMNDQHALCSPKWCTLYAAGQCKGAHL